MPKLAELRTTHSYVVRPFYVAQDVSEALRFTAVEHGGRYAQPGMTALPTDELPVSSLRFHWNLDMAGLRNSLAVSGIDVSGVDLALVAYGNPIPVMEIVFRESVDRIDSLSPVDLDAESVVLASPLGFSLRAFLYLNKGIPDAGDGPSLPGTWLAREKFTFTRENVLSRLSPIPLRQEDRSRFGLPKDAMTYVWVDADITVVESLDDSIRVYLDENVFRLVQESPSAPLASIIQVNLATDTIAIAMTRIATDLSGESDIQERCTNAGAESSAWYHFAEHVSKLLGQTPSFALESFLSDPAGQRARIEAALGVMRRTSLALREVQ